MKVYLAGVTGGGGTGYAFFLKNAIKAEKQLRKKLFRHRLLSYHYINDKKK